VSSTDVDDKGGDRAHLTASEMTNRHTPVAAAVTSTSKRPTNIMSTVWCLIIDHNKQLIGRPFRVSLTTNIDIDQLIKDVEKQASLTAPAYQLIVWQSKEPKLLASLPTRQLQQLIANMDLSNESVAIELASAEKVVDLGLDENEILLVQLPSAFQPSSCYSYIPTRPAITEVYNKYDEVLGQRHNNKRKRSGSDRPQLSAIPNQLLIKLTMCDYINLSYQMRHLKNVQINSIGENITSLRQRLPLSLQKQSDTKRRGKIP
jgi:hypothetical protein